MMIAVSAEHYTRLPGRICRAKCNIARRTPPYLPLKDLQIRPAGWPTVKRQQRPAEFAICNLTDSIREPGLMLLSVNSHVNLANNRPPLNKKTRQDLCYFSRATAPSLRRISRSYGG
jgi:hypothetical protein